MRTVWEKLLAATGHRTIGQEVLSDLGRYSQRALEAPRGRSPGGGPPLVEDDPGLPFDFDAVLLA